MDELPPLDFSCTDEFRLRTERLSDKHTDVTELAREEIPFISSRGCVFRCTYCCNAKLRQVYNGAGYYVRKNSIAESIDRVATLRQGHFPNAKYVFFVDDDFPGSKDSRASGICREFSAKSWIAV